MGAISGSTTNGVARLFGGIKPCLCALLLGWASLCVSTTSLFAQAQVSSASISGTVMDNSGAVTPGVKVTLSDPGALAMRECRFSTSLVSAAGRSQLHEFRWNRAPSGNSTRPGPAVSSVAGGQWSVASESDGREITLAGDFLRCGGQARTVSPVDVTAVRGSQLTYCA